MARHNNISRSLQIMSRLQGWDPCRIEGTEYPGCEYNEDRVTKGSNTRGPAPADPQGSTPSASMPGGDTRSPGPGGAGHGVHDPYAGK